MSKINNYIVIDFETGGLDKKTNYHTKNYPICEFAALSLSGVDYSEILRYDNVIKPYDQTLLYEQEAINVHHLSKEICERDGVTLKTYIEDFEAICQETNSSGSKIARPILVGHNPTFDIPFLCETVSKRGKIDLSKLLSGYVDHFGNWQPHYIDTLQLCKNVEGHSIDKTIKFNLAECCKRFDVQLSDAHRALTDVVATSQLFVALMTRLRSSSTTGGDRGVVSFRKKFQI